MYISNDNKVFANVGINKHVRNIGLSWHHTALWDIWSTVVTKRCSSRLSHAFPHCCIILIHYTATQTCYTYGKPVQRSLVQWKFLLHMDIKSKDEINKSFTNRFVINIVWYFTDLLLPLAEAFRGFRLKEAETFFLPGTVVW